jgi:hypothetical protein
MHSMSKYVLIHHKYMKVLTQYTICYSMVLIYTAIFDYIHVHTTEKISIFKK